MNKKLYNFLLKSYRNLGLDQEKMIRDILKQRIISLKQAITMSGHKFIYEKSFSNGKFFGCY